MTAGKGGQYEWLLLVCRQVHPHHVQRLSLRPDADFPEHSQVSSQTCTLQPSNLRTSVVPGPLLRTRLTGDFWSKGTLKSRTSFLSVSVLLTPESPLPSQEGPEFRGCFWYSLQALRDAAARRDCELDYPDEPELNLFPEPVCLYLSRMCPCMSMYNLH